MSRIDPITAQEWAKIRASLRRVVAERSWGSADASAWAENTYGLIFDGLWATGAHPSVFADPMKNRVNVREDEEGWVMEWRRPKTKRVCAMPLQKDLADGLRAYFFTEGPWPHYTTRSILRAMRAASAEAGVEDVTPKTIRHTVGFNLFKAHGPTVAKDSLGVSDRVLQDYLRLTDKARMRAIRQGMRPDRKAKPAAIIDSDTTVKETQDAVQS